ncbi:Glucose 1-dehydrogenase [Rhodobacteraceae bacterium THAF1]|uniref:SDR family oxidoreductase n=1 Tax=Palleronia sp. THAF1 TaxID=2587842 RepID=UPI000F40C82F|nr:SDR family oxidoreductase [Palleronia sp. THAF1]QFU08686.1 Glucose 1-dehydrogenase [Palleronia sp. THAF1]VDC28433.1 Glucose 1-dehydrogenase [Rhodobacteraceae bacterium THAF1]
MKHALITGAANGIGRGIVLHLLNLGWYVAALDRDADGLAALPDHDRMTRLIADVSEEASVRDAVSGLEALDLVVSNAGLAGPVSGPVEELALSDWTDWIGTNLTGGFLIAKHTTPKLRAAKGNLIFMTSTRAEMSEPNTEAYAATKGGLVALTHALAISLGPDVRVNAIAPGWIVTGDPSELRDVDHTQHPVGRAGVPQDIARAVAYLAEAEFTTGQVLTIDGGMTRKMIYAE